MYVREVRLNCKATLAWLSIKKRIQPIIVQEALLMMPLKFLMP
jgi:hypothetical protein